MAREPLTPRPTIYNGIRMRSRLEARAAAFFDSVGFTWQYEPNAFASTAGQYLPDFAIETPVAPFRVQPRRLYLEIKGRLDDAALDDLLERVAIILRSEPDALLAVTDAKILENGFLYVRWPELTQWAPTIIVRCPDSDEVVLAPQLAVDRFWAHCSDEFCPGYIVDRDFHRLKLPEYGT